MANWVKVDQDAVGFSDGNAGHSYTIPAGAPTAGDWDVIFLNSNTVLASTPSGWTRTLDLIANYGAGNQGAYALTRKAVGGEPGSITVTTTGNFNTCLSWSRWRGGNAIDVATAAVIDASAGSVTPAVSTGTLTDPDDLVIACAALQGSFPTITPSWTAGYTTLTGVQYNGGSLDEVSAYAAYRTDGGTAAETPQADWTSDPVAPVADRYIMVLTFTPSASQTVNLGQSTETDTALPIARVKTLTLGIAVDTHTALPAAGTKARSLGQASTTDTAPAATTMRSRTLGQAVETSTALAVTRTKTRALGQPGETSTALPVTRMRSITLGLAVETSTALPATRTKTRLLGLAAEASIGLPLAFGGLPALRDLGGSLVAAGYGGTLLTTDVLGGSLT